jgi:hypothetical protein
MHRYKPKLVLRVVLYQSKVPIYIIEFVDVIETTLMLKSQYVSKKMIQNKNKKEFCGLET